MEVSPVAVEELTSTRLMDEMRCRFHSCSNVGDGPFMIPFVSLVSCCCVDNASLDSTAGRSCSGDLTGGDDHSGF